MAGKIEIKFIDKLGKETSSQDIRCPKGHKVAEKKGDKVEIKCGSCGLTVEVEGI